MVLSLVEVLCIDILITIYMTLLALDPKCQKRAVTKGNMREFITKIGLEKAFKSEMKRAVDQCLRDEIADFLISRVKKLDDVDEYVVDYECCDSDDEEEAQD